MNTSLRIARAQAALESLFVGDALSMPVHWFYRPADILRVFPPLGITGMEAAPDTHPSSIMALHSTTSGGRSKAGRHPKEKQRQIVGEVILKGRADLWNTPTIHYHHGMDAGENTLNAYWARCLMNWLSEHRQYELEPWLESYIEFMTADPPRHPDTYAESCHRGFFANLEAGKALTECGAVTHDTPSMGALVTVAPLALAMMSDHDLDKIQETCRLHVWSTHPDEGLMKVVDSYVALMFELLNRSQEGDCSALFYAASLAGTGDNIEKLVNSGKGDSEVVGGRYSLACYIDDSWPSVCFLAARYHQDPERALLVNTNLGGENAHRGAVLGTLVGLASAASPDSLYLELVHQQKIKSEIGIWLKSFYDS